MFTYCNHTANSCTRVSSLQTRSAHVKQVDSFLPLSLSHFRAVAFRLSEVILKISNIVISIVCSKKISCKAPAVHSFCVLKIITAQKFV